MRIVYCVSTWRLSVFKDWYNAQMGVAPSLCNYITNTDQRRSYLDSSCSREPMHNVDNSISMYNPNSNEVGTLC